MRIYLVVLAALLAICAIGSVDAVVPDNVASVSAQSVETIELNMPDVSSWTLNIGSNEKDTNFAARGNVNFDVYAREDGGDGKLQSGSTPMQNAIQIVTTNFNKYLSGTNQQIAGTISYGPHGWPGLSFDLKYKQLLTYNDPAGAYSMTILYTGQKHV